VAEVEAELAAAEKAQDEAERQATKELTQSRHVHGKQEAHDKVEKRKAKLPRHDEAATAAS
jgi:hypothetical protein